MGILQSTNVYISNGYILTAIFQMAISNSHILTAIFRTAVSFISIYTDSFTPFCEEPITSLLLPHLKMSRLYHLDSSSSSNDDDDNPELIFGALHQAHTRYLAMHTPRWGAPYLAVNIFIVAVNIFIVIEKLDIGDCTMTISFSDAPTYDASIFRRRCVKLSFFPHLLHASI